MSKTEETIYFKETGVTNTEQVLLLVKKRAEKTGIRTIVVATTRGETGVKVAENFRGYNIIAVTHSTGFRGPDVQELTPENHRRIISAGGKVLTTTHAFGGVGRAIRRKLNTYQSDEIIANPLRIFGEGTKVAVEITIMAADSGLISIQEDLIAVGGSGKGADTALVLTPSNVQNFFNLKVREIICKPQL